MGKSYGPLSSFYHTDLARDWLARCDALQKFRRFFHRKLYAKSDKFVAAAVFLRLRRFVSRRLRRSRSTGGTRCPQRVGNQARTKRSYYISRPIAAATARRRGMSSAKISGVSAWLPSLLASSGESCTSIISAS